MPHGQSKQNIKAVQYGLQLRSVWLSFHTGYISRGRGFLNKKMRGGSIVTVSKNGWVNAHLGFKGRSVLVVAARKWYVL